MVNQKIAIANKYLSNPENISFHKVVLGVYLHLFIDELKNGLGLYCQLVIRGNSYFLQPDKQWGTEIYIFESLDDLKRVFVTEEEW